MVRKWFLWAFLPLLCASWYLFVHKQEKTLLITGCARSGTNYTAKLLEEAGLAIGHEQMKRDGVSSWYLSADIQEKKRRVNPTRFHFAHRFHQVRHPLQVISSVYTTENRHSWNYIMKHLPQIQVQDSHLVKCAKYWYYWNKMAEEKAEWTYRVEDLDTLWGEFAQRTGKTIDPEALARVPKNLNTRGAHLKEFTWEDLRRELDPELFRNIAELAQKYGYETP